MNFLSLFSRQSLMGGQKQTWLSSCIQGPVFETFIHFCSLCSMRSQCHPPYLVTGTIPVVVTLFLRSASCLQILCTPYSHQCSQYKPQVLPLNIQDFCTLLTISFLHLEIRFSCSPGQHQIHYVAEALRFLILLPLLPQYLNYRYWSQCDLCSVEH